MGDFEVLIGELLTVDGLATGALFNRNGLAIVSSWKTIAKRKGNWIAYVATGEVTTLEHELGDDTVELGALVTLDLGLGAELSEVLGSLGNNVVVELEVNTALGGWIGKHLLATLT